MEKDYQYYNNSLLILLSHFLQENATIIDEKQIQNVCNCGVDKEYAYRLLLINYLGIEDDFFIHEYFNNLVHLLNQNNYLNNSYLTNIHLNSCSKGNWIFKESSYEPFELFVCDDFLYEKEKIIPQLGFFDQKFVYPSVYENNVLWMSITPNEINTMTKPIQEANGKVLTFGLGLGYFAYMASLKKEVESVTIIEKDQNVISLFQEHILPQFQNKDKIHIIQCDAYDYLNKMKDNEYNYVFVDIYHDAGDGKEVYLKFLNKVKELHNTKFDFWIYDTIKAYL